MKLQLIENWQGAWKLWSVQLSLLWSVVCSVFVALPADKQAALINLAGVSGEGALAAFEFFALVSAAYTAAIAGSRVVRQAPAAE